MVKVDKVYVLHVKKGYEDRALSINRQFERLNIEFEYVLDGDISDLTDEIIQNYFNEPMYKSPAAMSCTLKHIRAHEKIIENNYRNALILEDDVVLASNFLEIFNACIEESFSIKEDHCIYYGNGCNLYVPTRKIRKNKYLYKADRSRAADSYSISYSTASKRLDFIRKIKCSYISDHMFNYMDPKIGVQTYWSHPTIVEQGSMNGLFGSSLQDKRKRGLFRKVDWMLQKTYKQYIRRLLI